MFFTHQTVCRLSSDMPSSARLSLLRVWLRLRTVTCQACLFSQYRELTVSARSEKRTFSCGNVVRHVDRQHAPFVPFVLTRVTLSEREREREREIRGARGRRRLRGANAGNNFREFLKFQAKST